METAAALRRHRHVARAVQQARVGDAAIRMRAAIGANSRLPGGLAGGKGRGGLQRGAIEGVGVEIGDDFVAVLDEGDRTAERRLGPLLERAGIAPQDAGDAAVLTAVLGIVAAVVAGLYVFFRTNLGTAMRAGGDTATMARALGRDTRLLVIAGLAIANGLVAASGAIVAQYQRFADVQMGLGMVVWGMASVFLGTALAGGTRLGGALVATVVGSVSFRLLVAAALRAGLHPDWLKFATAVVVLAALVAPGLAVRFRPRFTAR